MTETPDPLIGKQLGSYHILHGIGEGGMARVYKAYQERLRREVAIKVISPRIADQSDFRIRFEREAQVIASLEHPNIVVVYDFGEADHFTYLVMQYVGGGPLVNQLRSGRPIDPRRAANFALQMAQALHQAHQRGIIHRDVKPQNMLISATNPDHLLLSDFGIAKLFDSSGEPTWMPMQPGNVAPNLSLTRADQIIGTLEYMAPEQLQQHPFDARADIYALGVVLFQMLTGQVPFRSTTLNGMLYQHAYVPLKPVRSVNPNTPEVLARITEKALTKLPEERFQSAQEMAQALEAALASAPAPIPHQQPLSGIIQPQNSAPRTTTVPPLQMPISAHPTSIIRTKKRFRPQNAATLILLILALALLGWRLLPVFGITLSQAPIGASLPTAFVDDFHNTQFQWIEGSANGLTATISNGKYLLTTDNTQATHFPYPSAVATLPANFTMTVQIAQNTGSNNLAYGLVFHLNHTGNQVSCYALVITSSGNYAVLRYDPGQNQPTPLQQGKLPTTYGSPGTMYTLQAIVKGNSMQFSINGQSIQINGAPITDATYKDGLPGLLVTGPTASFTVTKVQVSTP